ncbi:MULTISPECIES: cupin domain-containing protein [Acetobacter]|uniref:cupin domain-containing protein n=1 Tax=Acetobacter TaxID=434 RepID=UPI000A393695|nr:MULTISPECIES: cupin domain-containing protein [Acetobacter]MBS0979603.1 cupin domain-containing protein [Acetobacter thailandicus]MBS0986243.1 cupin domain-containing protein [Acetobacter thailandicus]MBS1003313.1 cupin domain-containing protein [Acetobacter thailandicus]OUI88302.1 hypothetical protein HK11_07015 [Acetobacter sp. DmW_043]OUJ12096.1 hypothetical protein HK25_04740 [Acetobacter sp. DsW_059]
MKLVKTTLAIGVLTFYGCLSSYAAEPAIVLDTAQIPWQPAPADFPSGIKISYVYGNPAHKGPFVIRVWMPPHSAIAPHTHSMDETLTVVSGQFTHYVGKTYDTSETKELTAGGFVHLPKNIPHALRTTDHEAIVEVVGVGPFGMTYVNPKDNPAASLK